ncbi:ArdC family protein [Bacillus cihuensis]|uniref:ArdC family protein n=1 Tax=Bacillus cihuensis TaxID=1208599 RepID=UPI0004182F1A|nr:ArdC family protein [Bacillus cihuensis]
MAKKGFIRKSADEKKQEVEKLLETLDTGVKNFVYDPERYKALLDMVTMMPNYSFNNIVLAKLQLPFARFIAPYSKWKELNRNVKKGAKALRILAPRFKKVLDNTTNEEETKLIGFVSVPVFDCTQTEGDPLPIEKHKLKLDGESEEAKSILSCVIQLAAEDECKVDIDYAEGANGFYSPSTHSIVIDSSLSVNHKAKTGVHELVHSRIHRDTKVSPEECECVAEGVAYIVCSYFGLDTSSYSFEYVRGWSSDQGASLLKYGETIQKAASQLIRDFERMAEVNLVEEDAVIQNELLSA